MADLLLYAGAAVFLFTYLLLSVPSVRRFRVDRAGIALLGAALMVALGIVAPSDALAAISLEVLLLLLGMMLLVAGLDVCGFFDAMSLRVATSARSPIHFLALLMVATAILSALVLNDTIVLLMTPIVVKTCRALGLRPVPFLVGEALAANIGSVATEVGNPQNAYIAIQSQIPFAEFTLILLPIAGLSLLVALALVWLVFRKDLAVSLQPAADPAKAIPLVVERRGLTFTLAVTAGTVVAFFLVPPAMLPFAALAGGSIVLVALPAIGRRSPRTLFERVDWSVLVLFVGLFIVMKGVETSGLLAQIVAAMGGPSSGGSVWGLSGLSTVLSNLISNVPAVLLLAPLVATAPASSQRILWLTLAASSTLGGNATILGAAANILVVQVASKAGVEVSMKDFVKAGLPTAAITVTIAATWLSLVGG